MRALLPLAMLAAVLCAACGSAVGEVRDEGAAERGGSPRSVAAPTSRTTTGPAQTADTLPEFGQSVVSSVVYLIRYGRLEAVARPATDADSPAGAVDSVLAGPSAADRSLDYRTAIPRDTKLLKLGITNGLATIDLSTDFVGDRSSVGGIGERQVLALAQVVFTVTEFPEVSYVRLLVDGKSAGSALGDTLFDNRLTREQMAAVLGVTLASPSQTVCTTPKAGAPPLDVPVLVQRPREGERIKPAQVVVVGRLAASRKVLVTRLLYDGNELAHEIASPCAGSFRQQIVLPADLRGPLTVEVYTPGKDGEREGLITRQVVVGG